MQQQLLLKNIGIRTEFGPIGLRSEFDVARPFYAMKVSNSGDITIQKGWLKSEGSNEVNYQRLVKQAMLIAAAHIKLRDSQDSFTKMEEREKEAMYREAKTRVDALQQGKEKINIDSHKRRVLAKVHRTEERHRSILVKFSHKPCCAKRERCFIIDGGELKVYRNNYKNAPITKDTCPLVECNVNIETRELGTYQYPYFEADFKKRLVVRHPKREQLRKTPFYLYGTEKQLAAWNRAFKMAKILDRDNDRKCMTTAISRATSGSLLKAYSSLLLYFQEMKKTGGLIRSMAKRLVEVETARGWNKMKLVYQQEKMKEERGKAQQVWAARFMTEKLNQIGLTTVKPIGEIRESVVTRIQSSFRMYRDSKIFDRTYPIGTKVVSRMRKAKQGFASDVQIETLTCQESLRLSLTDESALQHLREFPNALESKKSTYSEVQSSPVTSMDIRMSDNFQNMLFYMNEGGPDASQLSKTEFSNFVSVDRISSVVLNTCPRLGGGRPGTQDGGVWCTIYGPRLGYGRMVKDAGQDKTTQEHIYEISGAKDGFAVPKALAAQASESEKGKIRWVIGKVGAASLSMSFEGREAIQNQSPTYAVLHVLGFSFKSKQQKDLQGTYSFDGDMMPKVPISADEGALIALDTSVVGVEIFSVSDSKDMSKATGTETLLMVGSQPLVDVFGVKSFKGQSLSSKSLKISLFQPWDAYASKGLATMEFSLDLKTANTMEAGCISPEFAGGGVGTTLFSSHRGAWYDPAIGPGHFRVDHVPNFVELKLGQLHLVSKAPADEAPCIRIRASIGGVSVTSQPMHRAKASWVNVVGPKHADPDAMDFSGMRLCLPLPPGCWKSKEEPKDKDAKTTTGDAPKADDEARRPIIQIEILEGAEDPGEAFTYESVTKSSGGGKAGKPLKSILFTSIQYEQLVMVDEVKSLGCFLGEDKTKTPVVNAFSNAVVLNADKTTEAVLNLEAVLRDRDYVRCSLGKVGDRRDLYVGDKVMVMVESPLEYPSSSLEFRQRFIQGLAHGDAKCPDSLRRYDEKVKDWPGKVCKLRAPTTALEYNASNFSSCVPKNLFQFKQGIIPSYCQDIIPHKFVCPLGEHQFNVESRPGNYSRIMDDLAAKIAKAGGSGSNIEAPPAKRVVETLTHVNRQIPATLLATYADGTCDVELAPEFVDNWRRMKTCKYLLPGKIVSKQVQEKEAPPSPRSTPDKDKEKLPPKARIVLTKVPTSQVCGTHSAGFHVFHSGFSTSKEALSSEPNPAGDFDLRGEEAVLNPGFTLAAGPLPSDASASACQYEWSLSVRSSNAFDMYQFVSSLRQAVRCDQLMQATRIESLHMQMTGGAVAAPTRPIQQVSPTCGALEIVLVEARRLRPPDFEQTWKQMESTLVHNARLGPLREETSKGLMGTKASGDSSSATPEGHKLSTFVEFRLLNAGEEVPVKGSKIQSAKQIDGTDSPCWAAEKGLQNSGGWAFKTGVIDRADKPELLLDFEVKWVSYGQASTLGVVQVPVFKPMPQFGNRSLADANNVFKSIWLPLMTEVQGKPVYAPLGEIHILTRWIPPNKLHPLPGQTQRTMKEEMQLQATLHMESRMKGARLRELVGGSYDMEAQYAKYNPNIVRAGDPESPPQHFERNVEALYNTLPYLQCLNTRQEIAWSKFEEQFLKGQHIAEARLKWSKEEAVSTGQDGQPQKVTPLKELEDLIKTGIPNNRRERYWQDLVGSSEGSQSYKSLVDHGMPMRSDANVQLQEDGFHIVGQWESANPPSYKNQDELLKKLRKAQNICTALIAYDDSGIDYCESILVLAFFLILPHGVRMPEVTIPESPTWHEEVERALRTASLSARDLRGSKSVSIKNARGQSVLDEVLKVFSGAQALGTSLPASMVFPLTISDATETGLTEETAFWLLVRLVKNGSFKEYYGKEEVWNGNAAMKDVSLLETFICHLDVELWKYLNAVGFHLSSVFYGAFMRLFATYMPVATVFRFWDVLFAETSKEQAAHHEFPGHGARQLLITFAYAVIRSKKSELLLCQSATEVTDLLLGVLGALYDCDTVIEYIEAADRILWGYNGRVSKRVVPKHKDHEEAWHDAHKTVSEQNLILKELMHQRELGRMRGGGGEYGAFGVSAFQMTESVIPVLKRAFSQLPQDHHDEHMDNAASKDKPQVDTSPIWGMYRPLPRSEMLLTQSWMDKTAKHIQKTFRPSIPPNPYPIKVEKETDGSKSSTTTSSVVVNYDEIGKEPFFKEYDFLEVLGREVQNWQDQAKRLWTLFTNRQDKQHGFIPNLNPLAKAGITIDNPTFNNFIIKTFVREPVNTYTTTERLSLNELFLSMIFLSKGTLGDKAAAVFSIFAHADTVSKEEHRISPSELAKTIVEKSMLHDASASVGKTAPPSDAIKRNSALHFTVCSKHHKGKKDEIGHVYIPSVGLYTGASVEEYMEFNIWPSDEKAQEQQMMKAQNPLSSDTGPEVIGEMSVSISWSPTVEGSVEGQLTIRLKSVVFYMQDNFRMNPWVDVKTVSDGNEQKIPRWDPRHGLTSTDLHASAFQIGAFGGHIKFDHTMRQLGSVGNETFYPLFQHGEGQGYIAGKWVWNSTWGKQLSTENYKFPNKQLCEMPTSDNTMCLRFARYIVHSLLTRTLVNVSNRQCMLIADSVFNRHGAVPGILGAILVPTSSISDSDIKAQLSLTKLKAQFDEKKVKYVDITGELALEQERQMVDNGGTFNLFAPAFMSLHGDKITLQDMGISDPYSVYEKTLVVRFVRGGDGERVTTYVKFNRDGSLKGRHDDESKKVLELDLPPSSLMCTKVTKEEFINCFLGSPLLGESLRDMGAYDHQNPERKTVALDVLIIDPRHEEGAKDAEHASHFSQTLLAEVWDDDTFSKDFLGEAWLPALSAIPKIPRDYVLPLQMPDFTEEPENGPSRHVKNKEAYDARTTKIKAEGEIYLKLGWEFPAYEMGPDGKSVVLKTSTGDSKKDIEKLEDPVLIQQKLNTGKLTIKIDHGRHLRRSDARKGRDCDPQVQVFQRNDSMDHWRKKPIVRTKTVKNNRNPSWKNEPEHILEIVQGDFEQKYPPRGETLFEAAKYAMKTRRTKRREEDERRLNVVKASGARVNLQFGAREPHGVEVYLNDSIREFKTKLLEACKNQAKSPSVPVADKSLYEDVKIGPKHLVMVYVPPKNLARSQASAADSNFGRTPSHSSEYEHQAKIAIEDPKNWQPLDPSRTFEMYRQRYQFGGRNPVKVRIMEATEKLKMVNLMYKEFEKERNKKLSIDMNSDEKCFGWAKYKHEQDDSIEWRRAFIANAKDSKDAKQDSSAQYAVTWLARTAASKVQAEKTKTPLIMDRASVLLQPRLPKMDHYVHPAHENVLAQAKGLRAMGKTDYDIETMLNKILEDEHKPGSGTDKTKASTPKPPRITVDIIKNYLAHNH